MSKSDSSEKKEKTMNTIKIPAEGSLGLLALGAVGIKAWRKKRLEEGSKQKSKE